MWNCWDGTGNVFQEMKGESVNAGLHGNEGVNREKSRTVSVFPGAGAEVSSKPWKR